MGIIWQVEFVKGPIRRGLDSYGSSVWSQIRAIKAETNYPNINNTAKLWNKCMKGYSVKKRLFYLLLCFKVFSHLHLICLSYKSFRPLSPFWCRKRDKHGDLSKSFYGNWENYDCEAWNYQLTWLALCYSSSIKASRKAPCVLPVCEVLWECVHGHLHMPSSWPPWMESPTSRWLNPATGRQTHRKHKKLGSLH